MARRYSASGCRLLPALLLLGFARQLPCAAQERPGPPPPTVKLVLSAEENALLDDVKDGKLTRQSFAEAALLASGATDAQQRKAYLDRVSILGGKAKQAVDGAKTPFEEGERLLAWIYGPGGPIGPVGPGKLRKYSLNQRSGDRRGAGDAHDSGIRSLRPEFAVAGRGAERAAAQEK